MKPAISLIILSSVVGLGCTVPNDSSIRFLDAFEYTFGPAQNGCQPQTVAVYNGSLDLSGTDRYLVLFDWESNLQQISTSIPPDTIAGPQRNEFVLDHFVFNFSSTPSLNFQSEQVDGYAVQSAGASGSNNWIGIYLLTPQARQLLRDRVQVGDVVQVLVTFQAFGALASGQKISSNKVRYPITVFRSSTAGLCRTPGDVRAPTGPCGSLGGQDGTFIGCCRDISPAPQGCPTQ